ncbi:MAG: tRNA epoxyqueuosine(34) reductase QueG, partial [Thermodesulfobacteriota bacterium]
EFMPRQELYNPDLEILSSLSPKEFSDLFKGSPIKRTKRRGLLRNVLLAMGNSENQAFVPHILDRLKDEEPLIRAHAAWALWKLTGDNCEEILTKHQRTETDDLVSQEIDAILNSI